MDLLLHVHCDLHHYTFLRIGLAYFVEQVVTAYENAASSDHSPRIVRYSRPLDRWILAQNREVRGSKLSPLGEEEDGA